MSTRKKFPIFLRDPSTDTAISISFCFSSFFKSQRGGNRPYLDPNHVRQSQYSLVIARFVQGYHLIYIRRLKQHTLFFHVYIEYWGNYYIVFLQKKEYTKYIFKTIADRQCQLTKITRVIHHSFRPIDLDSLFQETVKLEYGGPGEWKTEYPGLKPWEWTQV